MNYQDPWNLPMYGSEVYRIYNASPGRLRTFVIRGYKSSPELDEAPRYYICTNSTIWGPEFETELEAFEYLVAYFNVQHPDYAVKLVPEPSKPKVGKVKSKKKAKRVAR